MLTSRLNKVPAHPWPLVKNAIFTPGPVAAAISGSIGGTVFSHNKGGPYMRRRAIPVNPNTIAQQNARARLATLSQNFRDLSLTDQQAWREWAIQNPITNALGHSITKSGAQSYTGLNARILLDGGTIITVPPIIAAPDALLSLVQDGDIGLGDVDATFTATPLGADEKLMIFGALVNSAGVRFVKNLYKFVTFSAAAETSPFDDEAALASILGTLTVGQTLHVSIGVYDTTNGQVSPFLTDSVVISTT